MPIRYYFVINDAHVYDSVDIRNGQLVVTNTGAIMAVDGGIFVGGVGLGYVNDGIAIKDSAAGDRTTIDGVVSSTYQNVLFDENNGFVQIGTSGILSSGSVAIDAQGTGVTVQNAGLVNGATNGVSLAGGNYLNNSGDISAGIHGVQLIGGGSHVINSGDILGQTNGIYQSTGTGLLLENSGTIRGEDYAVRIGRSAIVHNDGLISALESGGIGIGASTSNLTSTKIVNSGEIEGVQYSISLNYATPTLLINSGEISGDILLGSNADTVRNTGRIWDDVTLGGGNDIYNGKSGVFGATVFGGDGSDTLTGGAGEDDLFGGGDDDRLKGKNGDDDLYGDDGLDKLFGGGGNDFLSGGEQKDKLFGQADDDVLLGGGGNDTLDGGKGDDILTGNGGFDIFVFRRSAGDDHITDFQNNRDVIDVAAFGYDATDFATILAAAISDAGGGSTFLDFGSLGGSGSVLIDGLSFSDVDATDFLF
ncbi:MAG: calcium-binding protein [Rhodobacteraceae bacterium]|nr:calcium-binding protein [Paracoccaceae bacterium]